MATSGTTTYTTTLLPVIQSAYEISNVLSEGEVVNANKRAVAIGLLNQMVKSWINFGLQIWKVETLTISPLIAGKAVYTIGEVGADIISPRPRRIVNTFIRDGSGANTKDIELFELSRTEYNELSNKFVESRPVQYYFDRQNNASEFLVWPLPDALSVINDSIVIRAVLPLEDMVNDADEFDFPQEWLEAITFNLAVRLMVVEGSPREDLGEVKTLAAEYLEIAKSFDHEQADVQFEPGPEFGWAAD